MRTATRSLFCAGLAAAALAVPGHALAMQPDPSTYRERATRLYNLHADAVEHCDVARMRAYQAQLDAIVAEGELILRRAQQAGGFSGITPQQANLNLLIAKTFADEARGEAPRNCPGTPPAEPLLPPTKIGDDEPMSLPEPDPSEPIGTDAGPYGTIGYSHLFEEDVNIGMVGGSAGYRFHPNIGAELEAHVGVIDEERTSGSVEDSLGISWQAQANLVGFLPVAPNADLLAHAGYGFARFNFETSSSSGPGGSPGSSSSGGDTEDFWSWGGGAQLFFDGRNGVRVDYTRWEFPSGHSNVVSVRYVRVFGQRP